MASPSDVGQLPSGENPTPRCQIDEAPREQPETNSKKTTRDREGYDCDFVERPKELETDCPVCLLVLREPFQVTCCGNSFCRSCIERIQADKKSCPTCNAADFNTFPDKRLRRSLYQFRVQQLTRLTIQLKESLEDSQCTIKELKQENEALRQEVNANVRKEIAQLRMEKEKEMRTLEASLRQVAMTESESLKQEMAELRRLGEEDRASLETVQRYTGVFPVKLMMTNFAKMKRSDGEWYSPPFYTHPQGYKMCLKVDANGRGDGEGTHVSVYAYLMRGEFDDHLKWPFRGHVVIQLCNQLQDKYHHGHTIDFSEITDAKIISQVTNGDRAETGWGRHTLIPHTDLKFNPINNCRYLKNDCLHFQIVAVESLSEPEVLPTELTMTNFEQHKINSDDWQSPPFYTHPQGYKLSLSVWANGYWKGKGTHVSVFAYLMRGEFDDHLKWPFRGHVTVAILNQLEVSNHTTHTITFTDTTSNEVIGRVTEGERAESMWGYYTFIAHTELNYNPTKNCQYLKYDCLRFRIVKVELK